MKTSRRIFLQLGVPAAGALTLSHAAIAEQSLTHSDEQHLASRGIEDQRQADLGNGQFLNPVLPGDHPDGARWMKANSYEVSGYNHNVGDGFLSLRPALFATGNGEVLFKALQYCAIRS